MSTEALVEMTEAPIPLDERLNEASLEERRRALRALLRHPLLTAMLSVWRGPSTITATDFEECLAAIVEEPVPDSEEGQNREIRVRLMRRLVDDPVLYYEDLDRRERAYLDRQRGFMLPNLREATGMTPEICAEGIALLDHQGDMTDLGPGVDPDHRRAVGIRGGRAPGGGETAAGWRPTDRGTEPAGRSRAPTRGERPGVLCLG